MHIHCHAANLNPFQKKGYLPAELQSTSLLGSAQINYTSLNQMAFRIWFILLKCYIHIWENLSIASQHR